jgi:hypothetical protein
MKYRIKQNAWGNWNGYAGNRKVEMFFGDGINSTAAQEEAARTWLAKMNAPEWSHKSWCQSVRAAQYAPEHCDCME